MVILRSQNKITDFLMILAWASPFKSYWFTGGEADRTWHRLRSMKKQAEKKAKDRFRKVDRKLLTEPVDLCREIKSRSDDNRYR